MPTNWTRRYPIVFYVQITNRHQHTRCVSVVHVEEDGVMNRANLISPSEDQTMDQPLTHLIPNTENNNHNRPYMDKVVEPVLKVAMHL